MKPHQEGMFGEIYRGLALSFLALFLVGVPCTAWAQGGDNKTGDIDRVVAGTGEENAKLVGLAKTLRGFAVVLLLIALVVAGMYASVGRSQLAIQVAIGSAILFGGIWFVSIIKEPLDGDLPKVAVRDVNVGEKASSKAPVAELLQTVLQQGVKMLVAAVFPFVAIYGIWLALGMSSGFEEAKPGTLVSYLIGSLLALGGPIGAQAFAVVLLIPPRAGDVKLHEATPRRNQQPVTVAASPATPYYGANLSNGPGSPGSPTSGGASTLPPGSPAPSGGGSGTGVTNGTTARSNNGVANFDWRGVQMDGSLAQTADQLQRQVGSQSSTGYCSAYVMAGLAAGQSVPGYYGADAKNLGPILTQQGFRRLETTDPRQAPKGAVIVYGGGANGHVEMRTGDGGFVSDYYSASPRNEYGSSREVLGIYYK